MSNTTEILCECHSIPLNLCQTHSHILETKKCTKCLRNKCLREFEHEQTDLGGFVWANDMCYKCKPKPIGFGAT